MPDLIPIEVLAQPAVIIDPARPEIRAANSGGRRLWGLGAAAVMPVVLDPDMPALAGLRPGAGLPAGIAGAAPEGALSVELLFWTGRGARTLRCRLWPLHDTAAVLVVFETPEMAVDEVPGGAAGEPLQAGCGVDGGHEEDAATIPSGHVDRAPERRGVAHRPDLPVMAHELRTPLAAITAFAEMIEREQFGPLGDKRYRDYARDIGCSARLTLEIIASALEQIHPDTGLHGGFAELDVGELIRRCARTVRHAADEAGVTLHVDAGAGLPRLIANATALTQILLNLLTNAIKFTPHGGAVTLEAAVVEGGGLALRVADSGVGMSAYDVGVLVAGNQERPADHRPRGRPEVAATAARGIGFSLVRRLAAAMSAKLDITSKRGVGTCVSISFPPAHVLPVANVDRGMP